MYTTLIDVSVLAQNIQNPDWVIVDCRFDLGKGTHFGREAYESRHIPRAIYAHLDDDLSSDPVTDNGRHPLPSPATLTQRFGGMGIDSSKQVVVYDDRNGAFASRLWWMLQYMGHEAVAVLDGGWVAWEQANQPTTSGSEQNPSTVFSGVPCTDWLVTLDEVPRQTLLIDSRANNRFLAQVEEAHDPYAGHIPNAVNYFFGENWANGRYLPADQLQKKLTAVIGDTPAEEVVFYCGSGVTACVNLLAFKHAGLGSAKLYAGSWSEWSRTYPQ